MANSSATTPTIVAPDVPRIDSLQLGELLEHPQGQLREVLVVDVRDPGTEGGFIKGAVSVPKVKFEDDGFVDAFIAEHEGQHLVFHCNRSNGRGPYCAGRVCDRIKAGDKGPEPVAVSILQGGMIAFKETHGDDSALIDLSPLH